MALWRDSEVTFWRNSEVTFWRSFRAFKKGAMQNQCVNYKSVTQEGEIDTTAEILANEVVILADSLDYEADGSA